MLTIFNDSLAINNNVTSDDTIMQNSLMFNTSNEGTSFLLFNDVLDTHIVDLLHVFINCFMVNIMCAFGIVGNCINIAVLCQHGFRETTNIILFSLSVSDLMYCLVVPITKLRFVIMFFSEAVAITAQTFGTVYLFMPKFVYLASSFTYVSIIAVERFVAVFFPFHVTKIFSRHNMRTLVLSVPIVTAIALIPTFFALTYEWVLDPRFNITVATMKYTEFYLTYHSIIDSYAWVGLSNGFCATSLIVVVTCCIAIGIKLIRAVVKRKEMTQRAATKDKAVKMLVTVCVVYIAIATPIVTLYSYFQPAFIFTSSLYELVDSIGVFLSCINASANFVIYVTMSEKFANTYRRLLSCSGELYRRGSKRYSSKIISV
ncbi:unnamed protein product [Candidula unifasciata]|uniref:G-protein coupled receptors family 1 profile domain-containing protein n=1 Tax=Candidula unifasciata TaxID=100452 RepID=A0A8S3ZAD3_9EUPU|nr:unnamed protein product [Candidula unifasciata]